MKNEIQIISQKYSTLKNQHFKYQNNGRTTKIFNNVQFSTLSDNTKRN